MHSSHSPGFLVKKYTATNAPPNSRMIANVIIIHRHFFFDDEPSDEEPFSFDEIKLSLLESLCISNSIFMFD